jgi:transposase
VSLDQGGLFFWSSRRPQDDQELGIADESLRRWIRQHEVDTGERAGLTTDERQELSRLRRENKTLRQDREFLKRAPVESTNDIESRAKFLAF